MRRFLRWTLVGGFASIQVGCICHTVASYIGYIVRIRGGSMEPTLSEGDICLVDAWSIFWERCALGELVVSQSMRSDRLVCKRLLGMEGDRVRYTDQRTGEQTEVVVPTNHVWLEGDSPEDSLDSRSYGPVHYKIISGRVAYRIYPFSRWGALSKLEPQRKE